MQYINKLTLRYMIEHCPNKLYFENYSRGTLIDICYIMLEMYQKEHILNKVSKNS